MTSAAVPASPRSMARQSAQLLSSVVELWNNLAHGPTPGPPRRPLLRNHGHRAGARPRRDRPRGRRRGADRLRRRAAGRCSRCCVRRGHGAVGWARGPVLAGRRGRRRLPGLVLRGRRRHRASPSGRSSRSAPRPRSPARSSGSCTAAGRPARWAAATALAGAGVALLALGGSSEAGISPLGVGLAVLAGGSYATYTLASKRLLDDGHAPEGVMAALFGLGAVAARARADPRGPGWLATRRRARARAVPRRRPDRGRLRAVRPRPARAAGLRGGDDHARGARDGRPRSASSCSASAVTGGGRARRRARALRRSCCSRCGRAGSQPPAGDRRGAGLMLARPSTAELLAADLRARDPRRRSRGRRAAARARAGRALRRRPAHAARRAAPARGRGPRAGSSRTAGAHRGPARAGAT